MVVILLMPGLVFLSVITQSLQIQTGVVGLPYMPQISFTESELILIIVALCFSLFVGYNVVVYFIGGASSNR